MNISFNWNDTLIAYQKTFATEPLGLIPRMCGIKRIRKGSPELIYDLQKEGHDIYIYTSSFRSKKSIKRTLEYYKIKVKNIINQHDNLIAIKKHGVSASKFPPAFNLDLHIDDFEELKKASRLLNFNILTIRPEDENWIDKIRNAVAHISVYQKL